MLYYNIQHTMISYTMVYYTTLIIQQHTIILGPLQHWLEVGARRREGGGAQPRAPLIMILLLVLVRVLLLLLLLIIIIIIIIILIITMMIITTSPASSLASGRGRDKRLFYMSAADTQKLCKVLRVCAYFATDTTHVATCCHICHILP